VTGPTEQQVAEALAEAMKDRDPPISFRLVRKGGKRGPGKWGIAEEGIQVHIPGWAVVLGLGTAIVTAAVAYARMEGFKLKGKGAVGAYGPDRVTLADIDYARTELGPIITPMEWVVGIPMYARAHRDYRLELAAEVAAPNTAGVPDSLQAAPAFELFTLSSGEVYVRVYDGKTIIDYWRLGDGSQNSVEKTVGTLGESLYKKAIAEGFWPPRKMTADERAEGLAYAASQAATP